MVLKFFSKQDKFQQAPVAKVGICLTPNQISAVMVNAGFQIESQLIKPVPKFLLDLVNGPDEVDLLTSFLKDTLQPWLRQYNSQNYLVDLTICPPACATAFLDKEITQQLSEDEIECQVQEHLMSFDLLKEKSPFIQSHKIWQTESQIAYVACGLDKMPLRRYEKAFNKAGIQIDTVQVLPLALKRGLVASGVVDQLLQTQGKVVPWAIVSLVEDQVCVQIWQGTSLLYLHTMPLPRTTRLLEKKLIEIALISGVSYPAIWFIWKEPYLSRNFKLDSLNLKAPVYPLQLGPYFNQQIQSNLSQHINAEGKMVNPSDSILNVEYEDAYVAAFGGATSGLVDINLDWNYALLLSPGVLV